MQQQQEKSVVAFVTDTGYFVPTVGAALEARQNISDPSVRIVIFMTAETTDALKRAREVLVQYGVEVSPLRTEQYAEMARSFDVNTLPFSAWGRLFLADLLPSDATRLLYLDGDVHIAGSLDDLFITSIPKGGFLAASDPANIFASEVGKRGEWTNGYFESIGVKAGDYFNSGVLLIDLSGWAELSRKALDFYVANRERCPHEDQTALNAVAGGKRGPLSLLWNYQSEHMLNLDPRTVGVYPAIWHFSGWPKPWMRAGYPWPAEFAAGFHHACALLDGTGMSYQMPPEERIVDGTNDRASMMRKLTRLYPWRRLTRAWRIRRSFETVPRVYLPA
jgi:lipopolysaccharide biosynthesis glycosyltransferase